MNVSIYYWWPTLALSVLAGPVLRAHPGHDVAEEGLLHWLASPDHLGLIIVSGLGALVLGRWINRKPIPPVLRSVGITLLAVAAILWAAVG